jgi:hypothetical protein
LAALAGLGIASVANAASVVMSSDATTYVPGALITLTVRVSATVETDLGIQGNINYQDAFVNTNLPGNSQTLVPGWGTSGSVLTCNTVRCISFSQVNANGINPIPGGVTNFLISTTTYFVDAATAPGTVLNFTWQTTPSTVGLDFFGVTNAPGVTVTVVPIPEPTTAAMLGLGLFGLALAGRRRS